MGQNASQRSGAGRLADLLAPTGEEELLNVEYPRPRLRVPLVPAAVAGLVLIAGVLLWNQREPQPVPLVAPHPSAAAGDFVVSVVGEVDNPGLVTLTPGARVADALEHARPREGANLTDLNHAQRLEDGQQIHVRPAGEPVAQADDGTIHLNSATVEQLMTLQGVGEVTAQAIVDYRESIGGFSDIAQLEEVSGIGPAKFAQISKQVSL